MKKFIVIIVIVTSTASFKANAQYLGQGVPGYDNGPPAGYGSPSYAAPNYNNGNSGMDYINQMQTQQQQQQQLYQQQQIMEQLQENNMRQNMRSSYR